MKHIQNLENAKFVLHASGKWKTHLAILADSTMALCMQRQSLENT
jgi:hypothetical protein